MFDVFSHGDSPSHAVLAVDFGSFMSMATPDGDPPIPPKLLASQAKSLQPLQAMSMPDGDPPIPPKLK